MEKILYIIPGCSEHPLIRQGYLKIAKAALKRGITPVPVTINWDLGKSLNSFHNYVSDFEKQYSPKGFKEVYIMGFSFGAIIAFLSAIKYKPMGLILCSLSPYFKEDRPTLKKRWLAWWDKNFDQTSIFSFHKLVPGLKTRTFILVGDKEGEECLHRAKEAKKLIKNSTLTIIKEAKHNISQKEYTAAVIKLINTL